ncbi:hypothetical protein IMAU70042_02312 [Lactiplantibacillus plantarum]|nr:hypothetical protein [Lactiplantibacillus plantarum]
MHVAQGQGLFGSLGWQDQWQVVSSSDAVKDWREVDVLVRRSPILSVIPHLRGLVAQHQLDGLVIDQLKTFNPLMDLNQLHTDLIGLGIQVQSVNTLGVRMIGEGFPSVEGAQPSQGNTEVTSQGMTIVAAFGEKNAWLINRFSEYGMTMLSEVTPIRLSEVYQSKGIGAGKIHKIQQLLLHSGLTRDDVVFSDDELADDQSSAATPIHVLQSDPSAKFPWQTLGVEALSEITPTILMAAQDKLDNSGWLVKFTLKYFGRMATNIPDWEIYTAILPMAGKLYSVMTGKRAPKVLSFRLYVLLAGCVWTLSQPQTHQFELLVKLVSRLQTVEGWALDSTADFNQAKAITLLQKCGIHFSGAPTEMLWLQSVYAYQQVLPGTLGDLVDEYWNDVDSKRRDIVFLREVRQPKLTLDEVGQVHGGLTREAVRQIVKRAVRDFSDWWSDYNLSLKLFMVANSDQIKLSSHFNSTQTKLITLIVDSDQSTLKQWVITPDSWREQISEILKPLVGKRYWVEDNEVHQTLAKLPFSVEPSEIERGMLSFEYSPVEDAAVWTKRKSVKTTEIVMRYMDQQQTQVIHNDQESFQKVNDWSKHYFDREIAPSVRAFAATLGRIDQLIATGSGVFKLYQEERYPQTAFVQAKYALEKRFASGYRFARDNWLLDQVKPQLPEGITSDEWYQVFKRKFIDKFNYSTGRNNDVYPLNQSPLTTNQQVELVARTHPDGYPLPQVRQDYGWELYTVTQAASFVGSIYIQNNQLFWLNINAANELLKWDMIGYLQETFKHTELITVRQAYDFFNEFVMDQSPEDFDRMRIFNVEALSSYLSTLDGIDVVGNFFILMHGGLPELPRESEKVWLEYLRQVANHPLSKKHLSAVVQAAGTERSTWEQIYEARLINAQIVPVSQDLLLAGRNIGHTAELDAIVGQRMQAMLKRRDYVATRTLVASDYAGLPIVHNREFPEETMEWTPELFISYAEQLGYRRLSWPNQMIQTNCDVLVAKPAPYQSMQELVAWLLVQWLRTETNEANLFQKAAAQGLVPKREDPNKWRFSNYFMEEQGFIVDKLGNVGRRTQ